MNWTSLTRYYGFESPFRFRVAIPFTLNLIGLSLALTTCLVLYAKGTLNFGTDRFYFLFYITSSFLIAAGLSRISVLSYAIFCWCAIDLGLALSSGALEELGYGTSLLPRNSTAFPFPPFIYHPLLQAVPQPNVRAKIRIVLPSRELSALDRDGLTYWRRMNGREITFLHNSLGLRGADLQPYELKRDVIFVYGGSTTYDQGVTQGETWVERLQADLNNEYTILNFGVPTYGSVEHVIQTAFYQNLLGKKPVCAIYYIGENDIHNAHVPSLDSGYADFHLLSRASALEARKPALHFSQYSPLIHLVSAAAKNRFDTLPEAPDFLRRRPGSGSDPRLEAIFTANIETIISINNSRAIKSVFVGQMLNRDVLALRPEERNGWLPFVRSADHWPLQERFNSVMKASAISHGAKYIDPGIENFAVADFIDGAHFSPEGSKKFAALISRDIESCCR